LQTPFASLLSGAHSIKSIDWQGKIITTREPCTMLAAINDLCDVLLAKGDPAPHPNQAFPHGERAQLLRARPIGKLLRYAWAAMGYQG